MALNQPTTSPRGSNLPQGDPRPGACPLWYYDNVVISIHPIPIRPKGGKYGMFGASQPSPGFEPPDGRVDVWCVATVLPYYRHLYSRYGNWDLQIVLVCSDTLSLRAHYSHSPTSAREVHW